MADIDHPDYWVGVADGMAVEQERIMGILEEYVLGYFHDPENPDIITVTTFSGDLFEAIKGENRE